MRLLLDTHVAIWALSRPHRLSSKIEAMIADGQNAIFISVVGIWEIAIKSSLNRISAPDLDAASLADLCARAAFKILPVTTGHALAVTSLPPLHADPFDRLMIAQAKVEPMRLVTHDKVVAAYDQNFISW